MSTPLEVIQNAENGFDYNDEYLQRDKYIFDTLTLLQALHDELEGKRGMKSGDEKAQYFWHGHSQAIQDQQDNLQALMDKIRV